MDNATPEPNTGCLLWTGSYFARGYGKVSVRDRTMLAHRAMWTLSVGLIPAGMFVCHRCDNPACISLEHLFLGTAADNNRDRAAKGRSCRGESSSRSKLSSADVIALVTAHRAGVATRVLAAEYAIRQRTVQSIVKGKSWTHLNIAPSRTKEIA